MNDQHVATLSAADPLDKEENAAWAAINTPLKSDQLLDFCQQDIERLFRINPYLEFEDWHQLGKDQYEFRGKNHSQNSSFTFSVKLSVEVLADGLIMHYADGLKASTQFKIEESPFGSRLTVLETYRTPTKQQEGELNEVDRSLTTWAADMQKFLIMWNQWRWLAPWRWYMRRFWQPMKPSGRRIAYMFWWITLVEIVLIALGFAIYWLEYR